MLLNQFYWFIALRKHSSNLNVAQTYSLTIIVLIRHLITVIIISFVQVVLSKNLSGSQFGWTVDGATIMSEEFYKDKRLSQTIVLRVSNLNWFLPPANKGCEAYVFTCVCHSVHRGVCLTACWDTPCGDTPGSRHHPQRSACWEIRATSGRYASYWNAILWVLFFRGPSVDVGYEAKFRHVSF